MGVGEKRIIIKMSVPTQLINEIIKHDRSEEAHSPVDIFQSQIHKQ